jgi:hypothetical protein
LNCEHDDQRQRIIEKQLRNIRAVWRLAGALLTMGAPLGQRHFAVHPEHTRLHLVRRLTARLPSETTGR